jgi:predicted nucleic acid-binding protein
LNATGRARRERIFVDTNIFVYADDARAKTKQPRARAILARLIRERRVVVSTQITQEYYATAIRKLGLSPEKARRRVERLSRLDTVVIRAETILGAIDLHRLHTLSFWDALIVKTASASGCAGLLTEDLADGQAIDGVRVINPFGAKADHL